MDGHHRATEWLGLEGTCGAHVIQTPLSSTATYNHVQTAPEYLQGWRHHNPTRQPVSVFGHLHREELFPDVLIEPPVFHFCDHYY